MASAPTDLDDTVDTVSEVSLPDATLSLETVEIPTDSESDDEVMDVTPLEGPDHVMECFSPRVVPFASKAGLRAQFSIDLETGHDLLQFATRSQVVTLVQDRDGFATKTPSLLS